MKPEDLTIEMIEESCGKPASEWNGKCAEIAHYASKLIPGSHEIYGHYLGYIDPDGFWGMRRGIGFEQHGWVLLEDGRILDPTRFSFENEAPYIYIGDEGDADYDEGGNSFRKAMLKPCPPPSGEPAKLENHTPVQRKAIEHLTGIAFDEIAANQFGWAANLPLDVLGIFLTPVYELLLTNGYFKAFIPSDNLRRAVREGRVTLPDEKEERMGA